MAVGTAATDGWGFREGVWRGRGMEDAGPDQTCSLQHVSSARLAITSNIDILGCESAL